MKLSLVLPLMLSTATITTPAHGRAPDVLLGTSDIDDRFYLPLTLVRNESIAVDVQVENNIRGNAIACRLLSGDVVLDSDNGSKCHLSAEGHGMRSYILQVVNLDTRAHQIFVTANRGKSH